MATAFKQVKNNAKSLVATAPSPATSGTSLVVTAADGAKFPTTGNSFWCTIWDSVTYPDPGDDPNEEIVLVTARATDTFTITRAQQSTSARTVVVGNSIRLLWTSASVTDIHTAVNALENAPASEKIIYDAVVATSGGDYTTLGDALAAGAGSIFVRRGTYTETNAALNTYTLTSKGLNIVGEDRDSTIIQLPADVTKFFSAKYAGLVTNLTFKAGNISLTLTTDAWVQANAINTLFFNCAFLGNNSASNTGYLTKYGTGGTGSSFVNCRYDLVDLGGAMYLAGNTSYINVLNNLFKVDKGNAIFSTGAQQNIIITGNTFKGDSTSSPVSIGNGANYLSYLSFSDNVFIQGASNPTSCILKSQETTITGNSFWSIIGNVFSVQTGSRALDLNNAAHVTVQGNSINMGSGVGNSGGCLRISQIFGGLVTGNTVGATAAPATNACGLFVTSSGQLTIANNVIYGWNGTTNIGLNVDTVSQVFGNQFSTNTLDFQDTSAGASQSVTEVRGGLKVIGQAWSPRVITASATTTTINWIKGNVQIITLGANITTLNLNNPQDGAVYILIFQQDATGSRTIPAWAASILWAGGVSPTLTATLNKTDVFQLIWNNTASKYYGSIIGQNY